MKTFTVEEVNKLVPQLREILDNIFDLSIEARTLYNDIETLQEIWGKDVIQISNPDNNMFNEGMLKLEQMLFELKYYIDEIYYLGGVVKDINLGLVDFYALDNKGRLVFLCWRYDEDNISHYHPLEGSLAERRHVKELMI